MLDAHVAEAVISFVVPSEYVPVAVNCCVMPMARLAPEGVTAMEFRTGALTVSAAELDINPPNDAVINVVPVPTDTASPCDPAVFPTVATVGDDELHVA